MFSVKLEVPSGETGVSIGVQSTAMVTIEEDGTISLCHLIVMVSQYLYIQKAFYRTHSNYPNILIA